jgi:hypothetical protein
VHYVRRAKWCEKSGKLRIVSIRNELSEFSSKSMNDCVLRVAGHLSALIAVCPTFGVLNGVKIAVISEILQSGTKYQSFRQNQRVAVSCEFQGLLRRKKRCALRSRVKQAKRGDQTSKCLNQERNIRVFVQIDE